MEYVFIKKKKIIERNKYYVMSPHTHLGTESPQKFCLLMQ